MRTEDKKMLLSLWKVISDPKYYELREYSNKLIEFLQRIEKEECGCTKDIWQQNNNTPVLNSNGEWVNPNQDYTNYTYSTTTITNDEWQKSVRYLY